MLDYRNKTSFLEKVKAVLFITNVTVSYSTVRRFRMVEKGGKLKIYLE